MIVVTCPVPFPDYQGVGTARERLAIAQNERFDG